MRNVGAWTYGGGMAREIELSVDEVARRFGVPRQTVDGWINRGLGGVKLATITRPSPVRAVRRVTHEALEEFILLTGRRPFESDVLPNTPVVSAADDTMLLLQLASERSARIEAESRLRLSEERLGRLEHDLSAALADADALRAALRDQAALFTQYSQSLLGVTGRLGSGRASAAG